MINIKEVIQFIENGFIEIEEKIAENDRYFDKVAKEIAQFDKQMINKQWKVLRRGEKVDH